MCAYQSVPDQNDDDVSDAMDGRRLDVKRKSAEEKGDVICVGMFNDGN